MAECGHCGKHVKGIRDHIKAVHGEEYYSMGPDFRYYGYQWLVERNFIDRNPAWDTILRIKKEINDGRE